MLREEEYLINENFELIQFHGQMSIRGQEKGFY